MQAPKAALPRRSGPPIRASGLRQDPGQEEEELEGGGPSGALPPPTYLRAQPLAVPMALADPGAHSTIASAYDTAAMDALRAQQMYKAPTATTSGPSGTAIGDVIMEGLEEEDDEEGGGGAFLKSRGDELRAEKALKMKASTNKGGSTTSTSGNIYLHPSSGSGSGSSSSSSSSGGAHSRGPYPTITHGSTADMIDEGDSELREWEESMLKRGGGVGGGAAASLRANEFEDPALSWGVSSTSYDQTASTNLQQQQQHTSSAQQEACALDTLEASLRALQVQGQEAEGRVVALEEGLERGAGEASETAKNVEELASKLGAASATFDVLQAINVHTLELTTMLNAKRGLVGELEGAQRVAWGSARALRESRGDRLQGDTSAFQPYLTALLEGRGGSIPMESLPPLSHTLESPNEAASVCGAYEALGEAAGLMFTDAKPELRTPKPLLALLSKWRGMGGPLTQAFVTSSAHAALPELLAMFSRTELVSWCPLTPPSMRPSNASPGMLEQHPWFTAVWDYSEGGEGGGLRQARLGSGVTPQEASKVEREEGDLLPSLVASHVGEYLVGAFEGGACDASSPACILAAGGCVKDFLHYSPPEPVGRRVLSAALRALSDPLATPPANGGWDDRRGEEKKEGEEGGFGINAPTIGFILLRVARVWALFETWGGVLSVEDIVSLCRPTLQGIGSHLKALRGGCKEGGEEGDVVARGIFDLASRAIPNGPWKQALVGGLLG